MTKPSEILANSSGETKPSLLVEFQKKVPGDPLFARGRRWVLNGIASPVILHAVDCTK